MNNIISLESGRVRTTTRQVEADRKQTHLSLSIKKEKNLETRACYFSSLYVPSHAYITRLKHSRHPRYFGRDTLLYREEYHVDENIIGEKRHYTSRCDFFYINAIYTFFLLCLSLPLFFVFFLLSKSYIKKIFYFLN